MNYRDSDMNYQVDLGLSNVNPATQTATLDASMVAISELDTSIVTIPELDVLLYQQADISIQTRQIIDPQYDYRLDRCDGVMLCLVQMDDKIGEEYYESAIHAAGEVMISRTQVFSRYVIIITISLIMVSIRFFML
jgi:hypothetical protein